MPAGLTRLLFCWELGANFGHLSTVAPLRERLGDAGFEVAYAVSDLRSAREILGPRARLFQAPRWPAYEHRGSRDLTASYSDILTRIGFADAEVLAAVVDGWLSLIELYRPAALVVDHSPAAQIAAHIAQLPVVAIGTGFTMPPLDYDAFPLLRTDIAPALPEPRLLESAQRVLQDRGRALQFKALPELFRSAARLVVGLPELDPYRSYRREVLLAPTDGFAAPVKTERRLFVYLGAELPELAEWIRAIADLPVPAEIYVRRADPMLTDFLLMRGKTPLTRPARMQDVLASCSHVLSQGGAMLTSEALAAGRPHFFLPLHAETQANARAAMSLGCGQVLSAPDRKGRGLAQELADFLADEALLDRTLNTAALLAQRPLLDAGAELARILSLLRPSGG